MTNQEINEAVARKLGVGFINSTDALYHSLRCPDYCHDIKAAWEIVEKEGISWQLMKRSNNTWFTALSTNTQAVHYREATADTAPMAICLAFLKLP